jgi:hypothetical protein
MIGRPQRDEISIAAHSGRLSSRNCGSKLHDVLRAFGMTRAVPG